MIYFKKVKLTQIKKFSECLSYKSVLLDDIRNYNETRLFQGVSEMGVFVAEFGSQVVGVCVLRREENLEYIRFAMIIFISLHLFTFI